MILLHNPKVQAHKMTKSLIAFLLIFSIFLLPSMVMAAPDAISKTAPSAKEAIEKLVEIEPEPTVGTQALGFLFDSVKLATAQGKTFINHFAALPDFGDWVQKQKDNEYLLNRWKDIGKKTLISIGIAYLAMWMLKLIFFPFRYKINKKEFHSAWSRFGTTILWLTLLVIPLIAFLGAALYMLNYQEPSKLAGFVVTTIIYALSVLQLIRVVLKFFLAGKHPNLRFIPLSTENALYLRRWIMRIANTGFIAYFITEIASTVRVPKDIISGFTNLAGLVIVFMAIIAILSRRSIIADSLRGNLSAARSAKNILEGLRLFLARSWHIWAILYLIVGYFMTMLGSNGGVFFMIKGTVGTLLTVALMRLAFYLDSRLGHKKKTDKNNSMVYRLFIKYTLGLLICIAGVIGFVASWGGDIITITSSPWGQRILGSAFSIITSTLVIVAFYELINRWIEAHLNKVDENGIIIEANTRARTLLPMLRKAALIILGVILILIVLSELGINIAPLLAGAGVLGVAIGFGSQTLVKDFLTGLFIILEDSIAVGDIVHLGSSAGVVEEMSLRTIRLRNTHGSVFIIPFSDISTIINDSKDYSFAVIDAGVAYDSDLSKVMEVMTSVCEKMQEMDKYKHDIKEDFQIMGVQTLGDSAITVRGRMKTTAGKHYGIRRQFNFLMKEAFDKAGIEIPFPVVTYVKKPEGTPPAALPSAEQPEKA